ncbi:MAG: glycosyltransferase family 2 protein [Imperialibacter sp.]|uniref:glycosyltransferase family 2 protein n=1 Tax=Imperialibacter sp. TaxID=2038411 RepID=UPI0030D77439|tara:strand:- start:738 stop:1481 length:744 start_codon:yes stop_codon:yes gene_type:complete
MKISIITVVYNNSQFIEGCILSVLNQSYEDIEYIIIDGCSTDGTLEKINRYSDRISKIVSERDQGIYDAMNKGIGLATGEIVGILNADDFYVDGDVITKIAAVFEDESVDVSYADVKYVKRDNVGEVVRSWRSGAFDKDRFYYGWSPPHPTFFVRRTIYQKHGLYDPTLNISADYEMMLRLLFVQEIKCIYLPQVIIKMRDGGVSNRSIKNRVQANREDRKAWEINKIKPKLYTLSLKPLRKLGQFF